MEILKSLNQISRDNFYLSIGNFDGVHLGHQYVLDYIKRQCRKNQTKLAIITFVPHPKEILEGKQRFLLCDYESRRLYLEKMGVDYVVEIDFHRDFSTIGPETFLQNDIFCTNQIKKIFLGHDFAFGKNKSGDQNIVVSECKKKNIEVEIMKRFLVNKEKVSSSIIRQYLSDGNIKKSNLLLGRTYEIIGNVVKGAMRGRTLGFPTANLQVLDVMQIPCNGVYITKAYYQDQEYLSLTSIGYNPTFNADKKDQTIEVYLLNFDKDIYGETLSVHFIDKIRNEIKFKTKEDLITQIKNDVLYLHQYFS
ncbi:MAG: riboflavin biosynthesis protein RibF [Bdellovibrionales bacterium RIFOXYB1_FULL_37_110]|nr:MAG: riboflavin biosynthesis protein RibF [Bdellovibrionales bacterium RIFOXYA1_FULL_38_20]OFZ51163.1 MAG: riboflavin biosynthesis protein RibF [Bdellovibrionales bacterium RIFOXYC1_FULL_37_79]OFZ59614.1 MAG: riboflavin biosynthesis protein RibF [Bdellovibrionales bacterium RIFOXYB2_FULL_36_6]OFZ61269.1 MAG: riboflavin biosynthesis protein RibF [Bdellovibrionales bacterium RIFOXYB1_FULL_37_110]OFZ62132.1 MAG: riboflavin biosynthesis protein RibF [Bdellovibrionales bacterium RIFOXYD1_FULL_36_